MKSNTDEQIGAKIVSASTVRIAQSKEAFLVDVVLTSPDRSTVRLVGIGKFSVPGHYQFVTEQKEFTVRSITNEQEIARVMVLPTTITAARPPLDVIPAERQFPEGFRSFRWTGTNVLQSKLEAVLGRSFNYLPRESGSIDSITTTFTDLPLSKVLTDAGVIAQVSLRLSFPFDSKDTTYGVHVQVLVQEGRALSDEFRPTTKQEIVKGANAFVDHLMGELRGEEKQ